MFVCRDAGIPTKTEEAKVLVAERGLYIGQRLRDLRYRHGHTQKELGKAAGLDEITISELERNKRTASARSLRKLAGVFGIKVIDLTAGARLRVPNEPGMTEKNVEKLGAAEREKDERDEQTRRETDTDGIGDRAP